MRCSRCSRELPRGFPGATVTCSCGAREAVPDSGCAPGSAGRNAAELGAGPYRSGEARAAEPLEITCPCCGNGCPPTARVCPRCDVRFDAIRCERCYSLQAPGSSTCGRCGQALELEPLLDPTDAPCPRCATPLESRADALDLGDPRLHECPRCGGMFVPREAFADILARAESRAPFSMRTAPPRLEDVRYVPCPLCRTTMNRMNFGKVSGIIVDVCRQHGTWFDGGELTRVIAFAANGGLEKTRAREKDERAEQLRRAEVERQMVVVETIHDARSRRITEWRSLLDVLFSW